MIYCKSASTVLLFNPQFRFCIPQFRHFVCGWLLRRFARLLLFILIFSKR
nr:MAG TPA: hypothetical protein [Bacteriophage sp.]